MRSILPVTRHSESYSPYSKFMLPTVVTDSSSGSWSDSLDLPFPGVVLVYLSIAGFGTSNSCHISYDGDIFSGANRASAVFSYTSGEVSLSVSGSGSVKYFYRYLGH